MQDRRAEQVERLVHHAWRGEVWDKALIYCRQAGETAMRRSASREAVVCFEQPLTALAQLPERRDRHEQAIDLRLDLRNAHITLGELERIGHDLHEAERLAQALGDLQRLGRVSLYMAASCAAAGAYDQGATAAQRALTLATANEDVGTQAMAHFYIGGIAYYQGDYPRALGTLRNAIALLEGDDLYERFGQAALPAVISRFCTSSCLAEVGRFAEGIAVGEEGLRIAEEVKHATSFMFAYWGLGLPYLRKGDLPQACSMLERAMGICQELGLRYHVTRTAPLLGMAYVLCGRADDALALVEQAGEIATSIGTTSGQSLQDATLGEAHLRAGHLEDASTLAWRALELARTYQERSCEAYALRLLGEIAMHHHPSEID